MAQTLDKNATDELNFETTPFAQLESVVHVLENGDLALEDALKEFERGIQLAQAGQQRLQQAEQRIQILLQKVKMH